MPDVSTGSDPHASDRLDSWKEIAAFLKRDVRTVQRWEKLAGLPVHRHAASRLRTAYAYRAELEAWWRTQRAQGGVAADEFQASEPVSSLEQAAQSATALPPAPSSLARPPGRVVAAAVAVTGCIAALTASVLWQRNVHPQTQHTAPEAVLVLIPPFEDHSGDPTLVAELQEGLRREMGRGRSFQPAAQVRIQRALRLMRRDPAVPLTPALARDVALRDGGIRYVVTGRVHTVGSGYLADIQAVDPVDGSVRAMTEWQADSPRTLLAGLSEHAERLAGILVAEALPAGAVADRLEPVTSAVLPAVRLYTAAIQAGARGQWGAAELLARRAMSEDPEFAAAYAWTGWAMRHDGGRRESCLPLLERAVELSTKVTARENYLITAMHRIVAGELPGAAAALEALLRLHPRDRHGLEMLPDVLFRMGRVNRAVDLAMVRAEHYPADFEANVRAAQALTAAGRDAARAALFVERARAVATPETVRTRPAMHAWLTGLPLFHKWSAGDTKSAAHMLDALQGAVRHKLGLERDALSTTLGFAYTAFGRDADAERAFRAAASPVRQLNLATLALIRGEEEAARRWLRQIPQHSAIRPSLFARVGLEAEAIRGLRSAPPSPYAEGIEEVSRGLIDARRGRLDSATRILQRGVDLLRWSGEPEYFLGIEELARIAESRGETTRAAALLRSAVDSRDHTYGARQWTAAFWARLSTDHARLSGREALTAEERRRLTGVHVAAGDGLARLP